MLAGLRYRIRSYERCHRTGTHIRTTDMVMRGGRVHHREIELSTPQEEQVLETVDYRNFPRGEYER